MTSYTDMLARPDTSSLPSLALARPGIVNGLNYSRRQQHEQHEARDDAQLEAYDASKRLDAQRLRRLLIVDTIRTAGERVGAKWLVRELGLGRDCVYNDLKAMVSEGKLQSAQSAKNSRGYCHLVFWCIR